MTAEQPAPHIPDAPHGTLRSYSLGSRRPLCRSAKQMTTDTVSATSAEVLTAERVITELERLRDEPPAPGAGGGDGR